MDPSKAPKTIDLAMDQGPEKGNTALGIYSVDGDTWTLCLGFAGAVRPERFETTAGSNHALEVLQRDPSATDDS